MGRHGSKAEGVGIVEDLQRRVILFAMFESKE
jgi:hypothetical protein